MTPSNTTFKPRALAPYLRAKGAMVIDRKSETPTIQVNDLGRVVFVKSYDHDDVDTPFKSYYVLALIANILAAIGVFTALMFAIAILMHMPDSWLSWMVLSIWGV